MPTKRKASANSTQKLPRDRVTLTEEVILLPPDRLLDTLEYPGCFAFLDGRLGVSWKGLPQAIVFRVKKEFVTCHPGTFQIAKASRPLEERIGAALRLWHSWQDLLGAERKGSDRMGDLRTILNQNYNAFMDAFGSIKDSLPAFNLDGVPDVRLNLLRGLENPDGSKARIFSDRVCYPRLIPQGQIYEEIDAESVRNAIAKSLDLFGEIRLEQIATWLGTDEPQAEDALIRIGGCFLEPQEA